MAVSSERSAQATRFFHLWQRFQERNGVVSKSYSSPLSLLELNLLIETALQPDRSGSKLSQLLNVPPLTISRALVRLEGSGLITRRTAAQDARVRKNALTPSGIRTLQALDLEANQILESMNPAFSAADLKRLVKLMSVIAAALPRQLAAGRPSDHPLRPMIRTLTRGLGLLGSSVFGIDSISTFEWHVLNAIDQGSGQIRALDICHRFQAQRNSVSVLLQRLERRGLVRRTVGDGGDRREKQLAIQSKGTKVLASIARNGASIFVEAMQQLSPEQANDLCDLFEQFIGAHPQQREVSLSFILKPLSGSATSIGVFLEGTALVQFEAEDISSITAEEVARRLLHLATKPRPNGR